MSRFNSKEEYEKYKMFPKVILGGNDLNDKILLFIRKKYPSASIFFGSLLFKLGLNSKDTIYLNYVSNQKGKLIFGYSVNNKSLDNGEVNKITLVSYGNNFSGYPEVTVENGDEKYVFECSLVHSSNSLNDIRLIEFMKKLPNGNTYVRKNINNVICIELYNGHYKFVFHTKISKFSSNNRNIQLAYEKEFEEFVFNLQFPFSLFDIYSKVCELAFGSIDRCSDIFLSLSSYDNDIENYYVDDLIHIICGEVVDFVITKDGKRISTSMNDGWSYRTDKFYVSQDQEDGVTYIEDDGLDCEPFDSRFDMALEEVEDVKKLARVMFNKNNDEEDGN